MAGRLRLMECESCGHMAMIFRDGTGTMVCCNQPMKEVTENTTDAAKEKHVPVIEKTATGFRVKVGSIPHPMEEKHFIEWVELITDGKLYCQFLSPSDAPEATFQVDAAETVSAREHCNLHGYWKG